MKSEKLQTEIGKLLTFFILFFSIFSYSQNCQGHTLTQGGWGAPNVTNPNVSYMYNNFNGAFPSGVSIGCPTGNQLTLTSPQAVTDYLPSGGTPSALDNSYVNPGSGYSNTLAAQLVAVTLAVGFDNYDPNFSSSSVTLGNFYIMDASSPFYLMTVNQFLALANDFIGGCGTSMYSASDFNQAATAINENYDEGNTNNGFLNCCKLKIEVTYNPILCHGGTTVVHVSAVNGSSSTTGTGDFTVGAGTHTFTVTDGDCSVSKTITITEPPLLEIMVNATPIKCNGGTSTVTVTASGGTEPYSGTGTFDVSAGTYIYTVIDANGCKASKEITITEPPVLEASIEHTAILCHGGTSTITVSATGGTPPYSGTGTFVVNAGGPYSYTVTDANGCTDTVTIDVITEPSQLNITVDATPILCHGGTSTVTISATGGTAPYLGTGTFTVSAGTYTYTVTDANGCTASKKITITEPPVLKIMVNATPILCNGGTSTVTVTASGGTEPYSGTGTFTVSAGTYTYTVTDANNCTATETITITEPDPLSLTLDIPEILCIGGTSEITATVLGGTPPYSYNWSNGASGNPVNLPAGDYSVTVTDANGCTISKNFTVKVKSCDGFTTITQGGWGAKAAGNNWGTYRNAHFASAFPSGLTIGAGSRFLKLTSSSAVQNFLPSGTTARALNPGTLINPGRSYRNVLAGQVVALTLSVRFDETDPNFSVSSTALGDLVVTSGTFMGMSVYQILAEANNILGGLASTYSASEINGIVDAINNNYDNGTVNNGLLACPCDDGSRFSEIANNNSNEPKDDVVAVEPSVKLFPNPSKGEVNLTFDTQNATNISVQLYNLSGKLQKDLSKMVKVKGDKAEVNFTDYKLLDGMYLLIIRTDKFEKSMKLMIRK